MEWIKDIVPFVNLLVGVLFVPLVKFLFDMRLKIERLELMLDVLRKEIEILKKNWLHEHDKKED